MATAETRRRTSIGGNARLIADAPEKGNRRRAGQAQGPSNSCYCWKRALNWMITSVGELMNSKDKVSIGPLAGFARWSSREENGGLPLDAIRKAEEKPPEREMTNFLGETRWD